MSTRRDYFADRPDRVAALRAEFESWRDTPFRERSLVKGARGGVDCGGFIGTSLFNISAIPCAIALPPYDVDHAAHSEESTLRAWFERPEVRARVRRVDEDELHVDGDLVFPVVGRTEHHLGGRIGQLVYHIARPSGYCEMTVGQLDARVAKIPSLRGLSGLHAGRYRLTEA